MGILCMTFYVQDPEDIYYNELKVKVSYYKNDEEGIIEMTTEFNKMLKESNDEVRRETELKIARSMIADNAMSLENIAKYSGLSLNEVKAIKNSINV